MTLNWPLPLYPSIRPPIPSTHVIPCLPFSFTLFFSLTTLPSFPLHTLYIYSNMYIHDTAVRIASPW